MNRKLKDFSYALTGNLLNFIIGVVTGFLLPKFLGIDDYGYLRIFTFYISYVGFMHLGFIDGIYLKYGNYDYEKLPKEKFRMYFRFLVMFQIAMFIIMIIFINFITKDIIRKDIMIYVAINMIILNLTTWFAFIHQFTKRFKLFSLNTILTKLFYVIGCLLLFYIKNLNYLPYVILQTIVNLIILLVYILYNKDLVLGNSSSFINELYEIKENIRVGFFVMIGNFMNIIILGIDRIFIDNLFTLEDFAMYSFAYSIVSLFYVLLNSLTMVMYPYMARADKTKLKGMYNNFKISINVIMGLALSGFFVIRFLIQEFLSKYNSSMEILLLLVPTVLLSAQVGILIANYYKVLKLTKEYTVNNIIAFFLGVITNIIAYLVFKTTESIAGASLISFILWVFYSDRYFEKKLEINLNKARFLELYTIIIYLITAYMFKWYVGFVLYVALFLAVVILKYKKDVIAMVNLLKAK